LQLCGGGNREKKEGKKQKVSVEHACILRLRQVHEYIYRLATTTWPFEKLAFTLKTTR
jgi:hypothetical protein